MTSGMDFGSAGAKVRKLLAGTKRPQDLSTSSLTENKLRDNIIRDAGNASDRFKAAQRKAPEVEYTTKDDQGVESTQKYTWSSYPEMMRDAARALFDFDEPELRPQEEVRPSHHLNREVAANWMTSAAFRDARPYSRRNELESLFGAMAAGAELQEQAQGVLAEHIARSEQMGEQEQDAQTADDMMEKLRKRARKQLDAAGQVDPKTVKQMKQQVAKRQAARTNLANLLQQQQQAGMTGAARTAAAAMAQAAQDAIDAVGSLPGITGGSAHNLSPDQQIALAEKWAANTQLRDVAKMLGRMIRDVKFKREARTKNVKTEPVDITTGRDFDLLLPTELATAYMPTMKPLFLKRFAESSLLQYQMSGKAPAGKGPIIAVHDGSGSMSGEPFVWATSLCLTLLTIAHREKRPFAGIEFGTSTQIKTWYFPKGQAVDPDQVLDYASHFYGGGTSIVSGLQTAYDICKDEDEFRTADVILISDGQDYFREPDALLKREFAELHVRIHGISILTGDNAYMEQMCEWHTDVQDLAGPNSATDKLAANIT